MWGGGGGGGGLSGDRGTDVESDFLAVGVGWKGGGGGLV